MTSASAVLAVLVPLVLLALWRLAKRRGVSRQRAALRSDRIAKAAIPRTPARPSGRAVDPPPGTNVVKLPRPR